MIRSMDTLFQDMGSIGKFTKIAPIGDSNDLLPVASLTHLFGLAHRASVIPGANAIGMASKVFDENGNIRDEKTKNKIEATCRQLVQLCRYESNREKDCEIAEKVLHLMGEYGEVDVPHGSKLE